MEDVAFWQLTGYTDVALPALFRIFAGLGSIAIMSFFSNRGEIFCEKFWGQENSRTEKNGLIINAVRVLHTALAKASFFAKLIRLRGCC